MSGHPGSTTGDNMGATIPQGESKGTSRNYFLYDVFHYLNFRGAVPLLQEVRKSSLENVSFDKEELYPTLIGTADDPEVLVSRMCMEVDDIFFDLRVHVDQFDCLASAKDLIRFDG